MTTAAPFLRDQFECGLAIASAHSRMQAALTAQTNRQ
jgi:hypothetical protein